MKRIFDIVLSLIGLLVLSPIIIIIAILIYLKLGTPIFFKQDRPGLKGNLFRMYKFRTMLDKIDSSGTSLPDEDRLTKFGKLLRSTSLDELPELFNVLKGEMSIVGPRPLLKSYLPLYNDRQKRRHDVKPGITGWAQINGRNAISWNEKFELDVWYVENHNLLLDIKVILMTIKKVIIRDGINADGQATMSAFKGNEFSDDQ